MGQGAPRQRLRPWRAAVRGAVMGLAFVGPADAAPVEHCVTGTDPRIAQVCYANLSGRAPYGHGVLGDTPEWEVLVVRGALGSAKDRPPVYQKPQHIFEDIAPRLMDIDGDGRDEIITVQSRFEQGARLAVFGLSDDGQIDLIAATPYIGTRNRWLAPIGAADLDGDGYIEIAYVDRPHLARLLRIWRFKDGQLEHVIDAPGFTNHRIGQDFITGGMRDCGDGPEMLVADAGWRNVMAVQFDGETVTATQLAPYQNTRQVAHLLTCPNK